MESYTIIGSLAWFLPNSLAQEELTGYGRSMVQSLEGRVVEESEPWPWLLAPPPTSGLKAMCPEGNVFMLSFLSA